MTFNLRVDTEADGINQFFRRTDRVLGAIRGEDPDLIGFQEASDSMRVFMKEQLNEYTVIGCGCNRNYKGTSNLIAAKKKRFDLLGFDVRWLSPTPEIPGSTYGGDQSKYPRLCLIATLFDFESGKKVILMNTHTDHVGANARLSASHQLLEMVRKYCADPVILVGDMNAKPDTPEIQYLTSDASLPFADVTGQIPNTFHWWTNEPLGKVDYIFSNLPGIESHIVEDVPVDGMFISDHNPVVASLDL